VIGRTMVVKIAIWIVKM